MQIASQAQYVTREKPLPGDRVKNEDGQVGTVVEVRSRNRHIAYGEIAVKWDEGVVVIYHCHADEFALVARA
jgi:signal peptidase I